MPKRKNINWPTFNPCAREEWDFRAAGETGWYDSKKYGPYGFLPDDEVLWCNQYEIARHTLEAESKLLVRESCPAWKKWIEAEGNSLPSGKDGRKLLAAKTCEALFKHHLGVCRKKIMVNEVLVEQGPMPTPWYFLWPEWPMQPFLSINLAERKRRFKLFRQAFEPELPMVALRDIYHAIEAIKQGRRPAHLPQYLGASKEVQINPDTWVSKPKMPASTSDSAHEIAAFAIDFADSNKVLLRKFEMWLKRRRQKKGYAERGTKNLKVEKERLRTELKNLGAARLKAAGMTARQAADYTAKITGKPIYAHEPAFSAAMEFGSEILGKV